MRRRCWRTAITLLLAGICLPALAEPLSLGEDLTAEIREELNDSAAYIYRYRYPQVDPEEPSAELINSFYRYEAEDAEGFEIPMNADYYRTLDPDEDILVEITYEVTCNNEDFFSVLVHTRQEDLNTWTGHTFSRKDIKPGSSVALPYLLGILDSAETDTWLQDRQTAKADTLVREMMWDFLQSLPEGTLYGDFEKEQLEYGFFPEEDFYLDETGNPVFYLQPGFAGEGGQLITFSVSIEEIMDEM